MNDSIGPRKVNDIRTMEGKKGLDRNDLKVIASANVPIKRIMDMKNTSGTL